MDVLVIIAGAIVLLIIWIFVVVIPLHDAASSVPQEYQQMTPSSVFLLFIPLFSVVWLFFVVARISRAFQSYFRDKKVDRHGSCGYGVGLAWAICGAVSLVPYLGSLAGLGWLVCMIIYLVQISGCKHAARSLSQDDELAMVHAAGPGALPPQSGDPALPSPEDG